MGNLSFEPEGGDGKKLKWLVIPFEAAVQVAACSIVGHMSSFRGASKTRTRNLEIPGLVRSPSSGGAKALTRWDHPGMTA
jgi:hypothetical protein